METEKFWGTSPFIHKLQLMLQVYIRLFEDPDNHDIIRFDRDSKRIEIKGKT